MVAFKDEGDFYRIVFALRTFFADYEFPYIDKELCCDLVKIGGRNADIENDGERILTNNGFSLLECHDQLRFCCGNLHHQAMEKKEFCLQWLHERHLQYVFAGPADLDAVQNLICLGLGRYDAICLSEEFFLREAELGNIVCLMAADEMAAVYFFQPWGGRIVVSPAYRGKRLSEMLRMLFITQPRWLNSKQNQYDWVRTDNEPSRRCLLSIGAVPTGKIKKRFIKASSPP